jgi:hypothetical protein
MQLHPDGGMMRTIRFLCTLFIGLAAALTGAEAADPADISANAELAGDYDFVSDVPGEGRAEGRTEVMLNGQAYDLFRTAPNGDYAVGFGMVVDGILGSVILPFPRDYAAKIGLVMYRIDGGFLRGYRLSEDGQQRVVGLEDLAGPPGLNGSYKYLLSAGADAMHSGFVQIDPAGEVYRMRWLEPQSGRLRLGVGVRLGDVLVAAYSETVQVGVVAYCIGPDWLAGIGAWPSRRTLSSQTMIRPGMSLPVSLDSLPHACPQ